MPRAAAGPVILAVLALVAGAGTAAPARAGGPLRDGNPFGLRPSPASAGQARSYFDLTVPPGRTTRDTAIISNPGSRTQQLKISVSSGVTAANSGSAYQSAPEKCAGAGCWVTGLPSTVTLAPGERRSLTFRVHVPDDARPAQYLAGITAEPAVRPSAARVGANDRASAKAIIIKQVTVGVAVTVGTLSRMKTALAVSSVSGGWVGATPRLSVSVRNPGQTFTRATGSVSCEVDDRARSYAVTMGTVLPGTGAVLPVNARGLSGGSLPCTVRLRTGTGPAAVWSGTVELPSRTPKKIVHIGEGAYAELPESTVPLWAVALMAVGALTLTALPALLVLRRRRRRATAPPEKG
ncbi:hypothetical protein GCM10017673_45830 [Streptosporangium violaceochromogenes]|nr:hypothetical protein GCM10017673_45830 [Streptosporangium violaceochromogenes]